MIVVTFLKRNGKAFVPFARAFSRALEDVPNEDALWVKAVRMYAAIARKPKSLRRSEMQRKLTLAIGQLSSTSNERRAQMD